MVYLYLVLNSQNILYKNLNDKELRSEMLIGKETMDSVRSQMDKMILLEKKTLMSRELNYNDTIKVTPIFIYITLLITLVLISISYIRINRDLEKLQISNNRPCL